MLISLLLCKYKFWLSQIQHQSSVPAKSQDDVTINPAPIDRLAAGFFTFMGQSIRFQNVSLDSQLARVNTSTVIGGNVCPWHPCSGKQIFLWVCPLFHHHMPNLRKTETESTSSWDAFFLYTFSVCFWHIIITWIIIVLFFWFLLVSFTRLCWNESPRKTHASALKVFTWN